MNQSTFNTLVLIASALVAALSSFIASAEAGFVPAIIAGVIALLNWLLQYWAAKKDVHTGRSRLSVASWG